MRLEPLRVGFALGTLVGLAHAGWAAMVAIGWAKPLVDFVIWLHFISVPVHVAPFDLSRAALLVVVTFLASFTLGMGFAAVWNRVIAVRDDEVTVLIEAEVAGS